jgi:outer membrane receptor protein involved in Fe transport
MRAIEKFSLFAFSLSICIALATASFGQAVYGSIFGIVTDTSGGVVPGATLTITNINTNVTESVKSNESGNFNQTRLIPGTYRIKIEATGFKSMVVEPVLVNVDRATESNIQLQAGQLSEEITITAAAPVLKTDRADVAVTFETKQVTDLPILDRNFTKFILLTPGTQQLGFQHAASENPQGSTQTMVNGQHFSGTGYQLDGTENRDPILGIIVVNPNFEAIGETKITSQNYDAEFGQAIAGVVSVSTKSGTNDIHGAVYGFRRNDQLQARNPFTQSQRNPQGVFIPDTLRNQFGGAVGGPIVKNRFFFFGDYDGIRSKTGGSRLITVPTVAARNGDLSAYLGDVITRQDPDRPNDPNARIPIMVTTVSGASVPLRQGMVFDPRTTVVGPNGQLADRRAFDGNIIPQGLLSQQTQNILGMIPLPNAPGTNSGTIDNYVASGIEGFDKDSFDFRIDGRMSDKLNLFGRYSFADFSRNGPAAFGLAGGRELVSLSGTSKVRNHSIALGLDYTWSSSLVTDFRFGFFRYKVNVLPVDFGLTTSSDLGVPGLNIDDFSSGLFAGMVEQPGVNDDTNRFEFGSGLGVNRCNCPLDQDENQFQFVTNTTKFLGNHTLKFGVDVRRAYNLRIPSDAHRAGELTFSNARTSGVNGGGLGVGTFLLGDVTTFSRYISTNFNARERQWRHFYYGQDSWRVSPKLTFNYGLRLDVINPQTLNEPGNGGFLNQDTGEVLVAGIGDVNMSGNIQNSYNFAPRVALAYRATDRLVVRVGYGRSYDIGVFGSLFGHSVTQNLPVLARQNLNAPANFERVFTLDQGPPGVPNFFGLNAPANQGGTPNAALPTNGRFFLPDGVNTFVLPSKQRLPSVDAYNATVQWQLTDTVSLETGYVGNKGTHVFAGDGPDTNNNQATLEGFGTIPFNNRKPFFNQFGWTQDFRYFCNCADNRYDSWQTKVEKRFSQGYSILAHYTLQRAVQDGGDYFFIDREVSRGIADWNRKHNFVFSQVWELPIGRGRRYFSGISRSLDWVVGGWQFNSNTTIQSGLPFNVTYNNTGISDTGPNRPNLNGDPNFELSGNTYTADLSVFETPAVGTLGNLRRNAFRGPGYMRTDASLFKKMRLTETKELEFRVEAVNFFNQVNRANPAANRDADNFGVISNVAYNGDDLMRNFQFGLRFRF